MDYIDMVKETIVYIEDNLEQKITFDGLACNALFSKKAHKYGLLFLESEIDKCEDLFMEKGIQFIISGINPNYIKEILGTYIIVGNFTGKELLKRVIILEGVLGIQRGESDYIIRERLSAYFGENYLNKIFIKIYNCET